MYIISQHSLQTKALFLDTCILSQICHFCCWLVSLRFVVIMEIQILRGKRKWNILIWNRFQNYAYENPLIDVFEKIWAQIIEKWVKRLFTVRIPEWFKNDGPLKYSTSYYIYSDTITIHNNNKSWPWWKIATKIMLFEYNNTSN